MAYGKAMPIAGQGCGGGRRVGVLGKVKETAAEVFGAGAYAVADRSYLLVVAPVMVFPPWLVLSMMNAAKPTIGIYGFVVKSA
jgi:hypothetical protein